MKNLLIGLWLLSAMTAQAQPGATPHRMTPIGPYHMEITLHKTTLLIFPAAIQSADRGDQYILAEKVKETDNILKVKAAVKDFQESNLSVVTADGKVYSFLVDYSDNPPYQALNLGAPKDPNPIKFSGQSLNRRQLLDDAMAVSHQKPFIHNIKQHKYQMKLKLEGIYIHQDVLYLRLSLKNHTLINYNIDRVRFYIRDRKEAKRTAMQEKELKPLMTKIFPSSVGNDTRTIIVAFQQFTIAEGKNLVLEVTEKEGDRHLDIHLSGRKLLQARALAMRGKTDSDGK